MKTFDVVLIDVSFSWNSDYLSESLLERFNRALNIICKNTIIYFVFLNFASFFNMMFIYNHYHSSCLNIENRILPNVNRVLSKCLLINEKINKARFTCSVAHLWNKHCSSTYKERVQIILYKINTIFM